MVEVFIILSIQRYIAEHSLNMEKLIFAIQIRIYDYADGLFDLPRTILWRLKKKRSLMRTAFRGKFNSLFLANAGLFATIFIYAAYLRFYDAFAHAAPAMSDAYVTLAWMKYINGRILFHDGIYPQGFHIILATLQKFAAIDALYVLKYTGPLNGLLISTGIYYFVSRLSGRVQPGIAGFLIYGVLGMFTSQEWARQASTNSQEFAFVFILPAFYLLYQYMKTAKISALWAGTTAVCAAGLVHSLAFVYTGLGMGLLVLASLVTDPRGYWKRACKVCLAGAASVIVSIIPVGIGLLMGKPFHGSSADYLVQKSYYLTVPDLGILDYCALFSMLFVLLYFTFCKKQAGEKLAELFVLLLGLGTFAIYYWGGILTHSVMVSSRAGALWALTVPVCVGMGWSVFSKLIPERKRSIAEVVLTGSLLCFIIFSLKPAPVIPYKMEHDSSVEQYLRISRTFRPTEWMIVSQEEGYALVYGKGYHLMMQDFLAWYNPEEKKLTRWVNGTPEVLVTPDIFIYEEKRIFRADLETLNKIYERREREKAELAAWLRRYRACHDNISIFYEDDDLRIWHIHQPPTREETFRKIWEGGGGT